MSTHALPPELLAADGPLVTRIRAVWPHTLAIYAFGSQTQGTAGPESDFDLGMLVTGYADPLQLWDVRFELETLAGLPVDLLDLSAVSTVMHGSGHQHWWPALGPATRRVTIRMLRDVREIRPRHPPPGTEGRYLERRNDL